MVRNFDGTFPYTHRKSKISEAFYLLFCCLCLHYTFAFVSQKTGDTFAIKVSNNLGMMRPLEVRRREFDVLSKLDHVNIVRIIATETEVQNTLFFILFGIYLNGSVWNIFFVRNQQLSMEDLRGYHMKIFKMVCCNLSYLPMFFLFSPHLISRRTTFSQNDDMQGKLCYVCC